MCSFDTVAHKSLTTVQYLPNVRISYPGSIAKDLTTTIHPWTFGLPLTTQSIIDIQNADVIYIPEINIGRKYISCIDRHPVFGRILLGHRCYA